MDMLQHDSELETARHERELRAAVFAECMGRCVSDQSRAFAAEVTSAVMRHEGHSRKYARRGNMEARFQRALEGFVAEILLGAWEHSDTPWVFRPLAARAFTAGNVTHADFGSVIKALAALELIDAVSGHQRFGAFDGDAVQLTGRATRWRASGKLMALADEFGINTSNVRYHFKLPLPQHPLVLRPPAEEGRWGHKWVQKPMKFIHTAKSQQIESDLKRINEYLAATDIRGGFHHAYIRVFNEGRSSQFGWNKGGRLYSTGERSYQSMPRAQRVAMTLNGYPVVEIDVRASFLTILHGLHGADFDVSTDPFTGTEFPRAAVKSWTAASLGIGHLLIRWPASVKADYKKDHGEDLSRYKAVKIKEVMTAKFPLLNQWEKLDTTWADLFFIESEAIVGTMLSLLGDDVPSLSMHDGLLVPEPMADHVVSLLTAAYRQHCGLDPFITVRRPSS